MKIGPLEGKSVAPAVTERKAGAAAAQPAPAANGGNASAQVALSPTVAQLSASSTEGVFDAEKVKRISDAIRDGSFTVNADAIADKLIANAQELLGAVGRR